MIADKKRSALSRHTAWLFTLSTLLFSVLSKAENCPINCTGCSLPPENVFRINLVNETGSGWVGISPVSPDRVYAAGGLVRSGWGSVTAGLVTAATDGPPDICGQSWSQSYVKVVHEGPADSCWVSFTMDWVAFIFSDGEGAGASAGGSPHSGGTLVSSRVVRQENPYTELRSAEFQFLVSAAEPEREVLAVSTFTQSQVAPLFSGVHAIRGAVDVSRPRQTGGMDCGRVEIADRHFSLQPPARGAVPDMEPISIGNGFSELDAKGGRIQGSVRSAASLLPVISGSVELLDSNGDVIETQHLDASSFDFAAIEPGSYYLRTVETEFVNQEAGGQACETVQCVLNLGTPIVVTDGGIEFVEFVLEGVGPLFKNSFEDFDFVNWHQDYISPP